jgi:hypothetical protein
LAIGYWAIKYPNQNFPVPGMMISCNAGALTIVDLENVLKKKRAEKSGSE